MHQAVFNTEGRGSGDGVRIVIQHGFPSVKVFPVEKDNLVV